MGEEIKMVALDHLHQFPHGIGRVLFTQEMIDEGATLLCLDPQASKILNGRGFAQHPRDHLSPVFVDRNGHVPSVTSLENIAPLRCNADWLAATNFWKRERLAFAPFVVPTFSLAS
jgi:hypothetical protein